MAFWDTDGTLLRAIYVVNPVTRGADYGAYQELALRVRREAGTALGPSVVIEHPVIYPGMPKTDPNDLLGVVAVGAACAAAFYMFDITTVRPAEWKGTVEKKTMLRRIMDKLSERELSVVQQTNKSDAEDVTDAIGIGLWSFGRLTKRIYPGATK